MSIEAPQLPALYVGQCGQQKAKDQEIRKHRPEDFACRLPLQSRENRYCEHHDRDHDNGYPETALPMQDQRQDTRMLSRRRTKRESEFHLGVASRLTECG